MLGGGLRPPESPGILERLRPLNPVVYSENYTVRSASKITSPFDSNGAEAPKAPELRDLRIQQKLANTAEARDSE